ncbi:TetR family transcriptional regulator [Streptomyces griseorubiginosus]|uniref:TetR family transcriptional regulator n=1 Tax=Streptomyces griseorubiginosus TaxID=67304 RepID=UPI0036C5514E
MQERAARTHDALIHAAAVEFDTRGYEGASLSRISKRAAASMGALTFHFATKRELAEAVRAAGQDAVTPVVHGAVSASGTPLEALAGLTVAVIRLLEHDVTTRAAARLERDGLPGGQDARPVPGWADGVRLLLERAAASGDLRPGVPPDTAALLLTWLVEGSRVEPRAVAGQHVDQVWELVLHGVGADPPPR